MTTQQTPTRTNQRPQACERCGQMIAAGAGQLSRRWDFAEDEWAGWQVTCQDQVTCAVRVEQRRAEQQKAEEQRAARLAALRALEARFAAGYYPPVEAGAVTLVGEEIPISGQDSRAYGGGTWAVVEPAERPAVDPAQLAGLEAEAARRGAAAQAATDGLTAWVGEVLPADAPYRRMNGGRAPFDGWLGHAELATLTPEQQAEYAVRRAARDRLTHTVSPDSYHAPARELRALQQATWLAGHERAIWLVRNNGADGDSWAGNNVRTGGAGAIGSSLPWSADLESEIRQLAAAGYGK